MGKRILCSILILGLILAGCTPATPAAPATPETSSAAQASQQVSSDGGQAQTTEKKDGFVVGYSNCYIGNFWRSQYLEAIQAEFERYQAEGLLSDFTIANSNDDLTEQLNQLNQMVNSDYDAIIINPVSPTGVASIVEKAKEKGILVVFANDVAAYEGTYAIGNTQSGCADVETKWLMDQISGEGKIVMISGLAGNTTDTIRTERTMEILAEYKGVELIASAPGKWSQTESQSVMSTFLSTYKEIDGIILQEGSTGVFQAYVNAGLADKIPPVHGDYTHDFFKIWKDNNLNCISYPSTCSIGANAVRFTMGLLQGKKVKESALTINPLDPEKKLKNYVDLDPPYIVTTDGDDDKPYFKDLKNTEILSIDEALALCEGKPLTYLLDILFPKEAIEELFE